MKAIVAAVLLVPALALAQVPGVMSFQGRLLKPDGSPETGSPSIRFAIYGAGEGGDPIWFDDLTVALSNGFYSVKLGGNKQFPPGLFDGSARWLGVTVGLGTELAPRQFIATVPYAFKAGSADSATAAGKATTADSAAAVPWSGVSGKPSSFPPSGHTHGGTDITSAVPSASSVPWTGVSGAPATFPPSTHTHGGGDIISAVATATSLAANGSNCPTGQAATGVDAKGNAEGCFAVASTPGLVVGGFHLDITCGYGGSCSSTCTAAWGYGSCTTSNCTAGTRQGYPGASTSGSFTILCVQ